MLEDNEGRGGGIFSFVYRHISFFPSLEDDIG